MMLLAQIAVFLQAAPDPVSGYTGWFGAGLLGLVLSWLLLRHLPAKDQQLKDLITGKDDAIREQREKAATVIDGQREAFIADVKEQRTIFQGALQAITKEFREEANAERAACEKHFGTLANAVAKGNEATVTAVKTIMDQAAQHSERNQQWMNMLKEQLKEERLRLENAQGKEGSK